MRGLLAQAVGGEDGEPRTRCGRPLCARSGPDRSNGGAELEVRSLNSAWKALNRVIHSLLEAWPGAGVLREPAVQNR